MRASASPHAPSTLSLGKKPPIATEQEAGWALGLVWTLWRRDECLVPFRIRTLHCQVSSAIIILTVSSWLNESSCFKTCNLSLLLFLMCMNMTGTDKQRIFVTGKLQKPYFFKSVQKLLIEYAVNNKAWVTVSSFNSVYIQVWQKEVPYLGS